MFLFFKKHFSKFSFTSEDSKDEVLKPIYLKGSLSLYFKKITEYLKRKESISNLIIREDYNEIYYVENNDYEITLLFSQNENKTIISSHVKSKRIGQSYKKLISVLNETKTALGVNKWNIYFQKELFNHLK